MSGKKLTRKEFTRLRSNLDEAKMHETIATLLNHIEAVGVFAPQEPTDEEINATIAKAQGWRVYGGVVHKDEDGWWGVPWEEDPSRPAEMIAYVRSYQPVSNLGQALEAAAALSHLFGSRGAGMHAAEAVVLGKLSSVEASRNLTKWMYDRIKDGDS